ncbi:GIN domain-containing protein [Microbulbifer sp. SA54]|uniref:GIN domain-containing protein n=1 Tax=Microbulbifer sp. SA54 TaxID=3401577 RepID=UPI003AAEEBF1
MFSKARFAALLAAFIMLVAGVAQADGASNSSSRSFPLEGFTAIALKGSSDLVVVQGDHFAVTASGPEDAMQFAKAVVDGDTLKLSVEAEKKFLFGVVTVSSEPEVRFQVTLPKISALRVTGSGEASADALESERLELSVTGSGVIRIDRVAAEELDTAVTGSGDLLVGTVLAVRGAAGITGSGDLRIDNFVGEQLAAQIKGSGDMVIGGKVVDFDITIMGSGDFVGRTLSAQSAGGTVMGSGDIVLRRPARESFSVMGSGDIALVE